MPLSAGFALNVAITHVRCFAEAEPNEGPFIAFGTVRSGEPLRLYAMSLVIDPHYPKHKQHEYGSRLIHGVFSFFLDLDLAERGIEIETITARSHTRDGIGLMQRLGLPLVKSPVPRPDRYLFVVKVSESGLPLFERYSELLMHWKHSRGEVFRYIFIIQQAVQILKPKQNHPSRECYKDGSFRP